jgi:hypothetical protein
MTDRDVTSNERVDWRQRINDAEDAGELHSYGLEMAEEIERRGVALERISTAFDGVTDFSAAIKYVVEIACNALYPRNGAAGETAGWRPIETAPKDGTRIHLGFLHSQNWDVVAHWECGDWALTGTGPSADRLHGRPAPSHWRPLPRAPGLPPVTSAGGS